jgi:D-sedoheptulose 7-phosphate isomerase
MNDDNFLFTEFLSEHQLTFSTLDSLRIPLLQAAKACAQALNQGNKIMLCGNGGSAADAQHIAAELIGRFVDDRPALSALALTTDSSALTCISNDFSYDDVFSRQLLGLGQPGDVLIGITTSGKSPNILKAFDAAHTKGIFTIAFLGKDGGPAKSLAKLPLVVNSPSTARIQEAHIFLGHVLCAQIERLLGCGHLEI